MAQKCVACESKRKIHSYGSNTEYENQHIEKPETSYYMEKAHEKPFETQIRNIVREL